jgi:hypothetical protein
MPNQGYLRCLLLIYLHNGSSPAFPPVYCDLPLADTVTHLVGYDLKEICLSIANHSPSDTYLRCHLLIPMPEANLTLLVPTRLFVVLHSTAPVSQTVLEVLKPMPNAPSLNLQPGILSSRTVTNRAIPVTLSSIFPIMSSTLVSSPPHPLIASTFQSPSHSEHMTTHSDQYCTLYTVTSVHSEHVNNTSKEYLEYIANLVNLYNHFNKTSSLRITPLPLIEHTLSVMIDRFYQYLSDIRPRDIASHALSRSYYLNDNISSVCFFSLTSDPTKSMLPHSVDMSEPSVPVNIRLVSSDLPTELSLPPATQSFEPAYPSIERRLAALPYSAPNDIYNLIAPSATPPGDSTALTSDGLVPVLCNRVTSQIRPNFAITFARLYLTTTSMLTQPLIEQLIRNRPIPLRTLRLSSSDEDDPLKLTLNHIVATTISYHLPYQILRFLSSYTHHCEIGLFCPLNAMIALSSQIEFSEYMLFLQRRFPDDSTLSTTPVTLDASIDSSDESSEASDDSTPSPIIESTFDYATAEATTTLEHSPLMTQVIRCLRLRGTATRLDDREVLSFHLTANTTVPSDIRHSLASLVATIIFVCLRYFVTMLTPRSPPRPSPQS